MDPLIKNLKIDGIVRGVRQIKGFWVDKFGEAHPVYSIESDADLIKRATKLTKEEN